MNGPAGITALRRVQLSELEILREFSRRCAADGLRWFVIGGTLLGAARHRGFIPWDDDIDVGMPRPDYERFQALCRRSDDSRFAWLSAETGRRYPFMYGKLLRADSVATAADPAGADPTGEPTGRVFIDVFPIDGAPRSRLARLAHAVAFKVAVTALGARIRRAGIRRYLAAPLRFVPRSLAVAVIDRLARRFSFDASPYAVNASGAWGYGRECQPRSRFEPPATLEFEGLPVPAPGRWQEYLTQIYGDYRQEPPPEQRRPRHANAVTGLEERAPGATPPPPTSDRRSVSALVARLGILVVRAGFTLGRIRPPRPYLVLATREAAAIDGNLRSIRLEIRRRALGIPIHIVGYKTRAGLRGRAISAWEAFRAGYHLAAARLVVADDWFFPSDVVKPRSGTTRVQVWHAAGAFKKFGYSVLEKSLGRDEALSRLVPSQSHYAVCLVSSTAATPHFMAAFELPRERFTSALGLPRTDAFFDPAQRERATDAIRRRYALPPDRRVLLYAPTYRGENVRDARSPDDLDLAAMRDALAGEWLVLLRVHPLVRRSLPLPPDLVGFVVDVSGWPEMNELMLVADLLVTDYSSAIFEFALLNRPMAFLAPDVAAYEAERGFYLNVRTDLPGPLFETTDELARYARDGRFDVDRVRAFARTWFDVADGHASERFVDRVVLPALRGDRLQIEPEPPPGARVIAEPARHVARG